MSASSRSGLLKVVGAGATIMVALVLIGSGVQLARNAGGNEVRAGALGEIDGVPVTVIDDGPAATPPPAVPVVSPVAPAAPVSPTGPAPTAPGAPPTGGGGEPDDDGGNDSPVPGVDVPPEVEPIIGLIGDVTGAVGDASSPTGQIVDDTVDALALDRVL